jgi:hypothetical protein
MLVQCKSGTETIDSILQMEQSVCQKILILLWVWWSARNKANRGEKIAYEADICSSVMYHLKVCKKLQDQQKPARQLLKVSWTPPPEEFYKINVDASFHVNDGHGGWGFVIRNHEGIVLQAGAGSLRRISSPLHAGTLAALRSVERAIQLGMNRVVLDMDAAILGDALRTTTWDRSPYGFLFRQIRDLKLYEFNACVISVCNRTCNQLAHRLAAYGACVEGAEACLYTDHAPDFVSHLVSGDMPRADV